MTAAVTVVVADLPMVVEDQGNVVLSRPCRKGDVVEVPCPHRGEGGGIGGQQVTDFTCGVCGLTWTSGSTAGRHPDEGEALLRLTEEPETVLTGYSHETLEGKNYHLTGVWEDR